jgi:hypothetical protein
MTLRCNDGREEMKGEASQRERDLAVYIDDVARIF